MQGTATCRSGFVLLCSTLLVGLSNPAAQTALSAPSAQQAMATEGVNPNNLVGLVSIVCSPAPPGAVNGSPTCPYLACCNPYLAVVLLGLNCEKPTFT